MVIPFTTREMEKAWRDNKSAANKLPRTNAHRLLLFYAVECGLKAVLMRKKPKYTRTDLFPEIVECQHNINKLLENLGVHLQSLKLPEQLSMSHIKACYKQTTDERKFTPGEINQMWRYGGCCSQKGITDEDLEKKLLNIVDWIEEELRRP